MLDFHCHLGAGIGIPRSFFAQIAQGACDAKPTAEVNATELTEVLLAQAIDPYGDSLAGAMRDGGVHKAVLLIADFWPALEDANSDLQKLYSDHIVAAERNPGRFLIFAPANPDRGDPGIRLFEKYVAQGKVRGAKVYPPCGFTASDPRLDAYYEICGANRLPVLVHSGPSIGKLEFACAHPFHIDRASRKFEHVPFVLAHGAVVHVDDAIAVAEYRKNVYLDISGYQGEHGKGVFAQTLARIKRRGILHKVIFGTDYPIHTMSVGYGGSIDILRSYVSDGIITDGELSLLTWRTAARLLQFEG